MWRLVRGRRCQSGLRRLEKSHLEGAGNWRNRWTWIISDAQMLYGLITYIGRELDDLYGAGDVGESEYGEKAEMRA